jgi:hypothetical protein
LQRVLAKLDGQAQADAVDDPLQAHRVVALGRADQAPGNHAASSERVSMMLPSRRSMLRLTRYSGANAALIWSKGLFMVEACIE